MRVRPKGMPIVMYLGRNIKEYLENGESEIKRALSAGEICCDLCLKRQRYHSQYNRTIKETGEELTIIVVWCRRCKKWHSLQPDFLLSPKHYSGNEIECVVIDSANEPVSHIETQASESTVRRWIRDVGAGIVGAVGNLKFHFGRAGHAVNEIAITPGHCYDELEQILELAPYEMDCCGNKLGLANMWLRSMGAMAYI